MIILDGREINEKRGKVMAEKISSSGIVPFLIIIQIGNKPESNVYVEQKVIFGKKIGAKVEVFKFDDSVKTEEVVKKVEEFNNDPKINGIILQLPVPENIDSEIILNTILPNKDVDGLSAKNFRRLATNNPDCLVPATANGILSILNEYNIPVSGKNVVIVGRSLLVGKSTALLFSNNDATVTLCHTKTEDLPSFTKKADIIVVATGIPNLITKEHISNNQTIIDVGISALGDRRVVGDVDFDSIKDLVYAISPVPGGIGPMTVLSLFENLLKTTLK